MLTIKYRNIKILFENHTDLLINKEDMDTLFSHLNTLFDRVSVQYKNGRIRKDSISFIRLKNVQNLSVYIGVNKNSNPYLFVYNSKTKEVFDEINYNLFQLLDNDYIFGDLEDKLNNIGNSKYNNLVSEEELKNILDYLDFYEK